jgi:predicted O-linked N-acetylglucosamine transferase (SPINDLY family)
LRALCLAATAAHPHDPAGWELLGAAHIALDQPVEASGCFQRVLELQPRRAGARANHAEALRLSGRPDAAVAACEAALRDDPQDIAALHNLGLALSSLGRSAEAVAALRKACAARPDSHEIRGALLFALNRHAGVDIDELAREHRRWAVDFADPLGLHAVPHANDRSPGRPLRVGYVSGDFRRHAVSYFIEPVLEGHDRSSFRVFGYSSSHVGDEVTMRLKPLFDQWREVAALDDDALAALIRDDAIDVLIDLSGHTRHNRLLAFARRPAPVQITWLGYLNTTGMAAMDGRLTDAAADPPQVAERLHRERLLRLPCCQWCYRPPRDAPEVAPLPALASGHVTFGSFNQFDKLSTHCVALWARILARMPEARVAVFGVPVAESADVLLDIFERHGIDLTRIELRRTTGFDDYLHAHGEVDIALDSLPYNGGTTTCESLWMGVPVVTRRGVAGAQRSGASLLAAVGLEVFAAGTDEAYVETAVEAAADLERLAVLRGSLRSRMRGSPLMDEKGFVKELESVYRDAWRRWCEG